MILRERVSISLFSNLFAFIKNLLGIYKITYAFFIFKHLLHDFILLNLEGFIWSKIGFNLHSWLRSGFSWTLLVKNGLNFHRLVLIHENALRLQSNGLARELLRYFHLVFDGGSSLDLLKVLIVLRLCSKVLFHGARLAIGREEISLLHQSDDWAAIHMVSHSSRLVDCGLCFFHSRRLQIILHVARVSSIHLARLKVERVRGVY
jgi:hypothetical protein